MEKCKHGFIGCSECHTAGHDALKEIVEIYSNWISVETLPEKKCKCLTYGDYGYVVAEFEPSLNNSWVSWREDKTFFGVTHWMPLPSPPGDA